MVKNFKTICIWSAFIGTNWFPPHSFVPTPGLPHPSTTSPRHTNMFCRLSRKNFACCFLVQSRPNTIANQQRIVIWHYEGRWNATCHDLSCLEAGHRPLSRFVRFDKICPCPTSRSHLFLRLFDKMYRACNPDQSYDNCFFVFLNSLTSSRSQKTYSHLFSVTSDTLMMKSTNCYKICPLVRIGP